MTIQKSEPASYAGVLVPDLNYRNYKTLEGLTQDIMRLSEARALESSKPIVSPVTAFLCGAALAALAILISEKGR